MVLFIPRHPRFRWLALTLLVIACLALFFHSRVPQPVASRPVTQATPFRDTAKVMAVTAPAAPSPAPAAAPMLPGVAKRPVPALFTFVPAPADAAVLEARSFAPTKKILYVKVNPELFSGKSSPFWQAPGEGRIMLPLPEGGELPLVIDRSEMVGVQRFISEGHIEGRAGGRVLLASNGGILHATIEDPVLGEFSLRYSNADVSQFFAVDPAQVGSCGGALKPVIDAKAVAALAARKAKAGSVAPMPADDAAGVDAGAGATPPIVAAGGQAVEVQLMMLYTQDVLAAAGSAAAIQSAFDLAVATVNSDFGRSLITAHVKLVKVAQVNYTELATTTGNIQVDALNAVTSTSDGKMDEIHALRDQVGADLVNLVVNRTDTSGTVGLAWLMDTPSLASPSDWEFNPLFGFSVVQYSFINIQHVLSHELGHNFGCAHDREHATDTSGNLSPGGYSYSYGYRFTGTNGLTYHDIMSYDPGTRLPYFSNPNVTPTETGVGKPIGIAPGATGESDTALTIEKDAFEVSTYRLQQQTPASLGTLINVATLAFAGTGDQQLIGGFVITGSQPKNVLVRAAGPALTATFGLAGALADPTLTLFKTDTGIQQVGFSDNWNVANTIIPVGSTPAPSAGDVATAFNSAGAFAFANGSKDSALYVSLNPGNYTVNITGTNNTTGTALVEAYEVGASGTKIVNLATRGYIASDKAMVAGFVISGDVSQTKRVLLRVRGPSLAQFGLVGAADPVLTLYNSASEMIAVNDDFSSDNTLGDSYGEAQIIATGFAPTDRREPCILVDLVPGVYTASVAPYSSSSQPAQPGIAVVEVFQIP
jgi:Metallo-peptidase family M12